MGTRREKKASDERAKVESAETVNRTTVEKKIEQSQQTLFNDFNKTSETLAQAAKEAAEAAALQHSKNSSFSSATSIGNSSTDTSSTVHTVSKEQADLIIKKQKELEGIDFNFFLLSEDKDHCKIIENKINAISGALSGITPP